jgi:hypothetical protein
LRQGRNGERHVGLFRLRLALDHPLDHRALARRHDALDRPFLHVFHRAFGLDQLARFILGHRRLRFGDVNCAADKRATCRHSGQFREGRS